MVKAGSPFPPINRLVSCANVAPSWGLFFARRGKDKERERAATRTTRDCVKPDNVIAGITSNGVPVREADTGSNPVNG